MKGTRVSTKVRTIVPFIIVALGNFWIWRIADFNAVLAMVVLCATAVLVVVLTANKTTTTQMTALAILVAILAIAQVKVSSVTSLTFLNDHEQLQLRERLAAYPPIGIALGSTTVWLPVANWLEQRKEAIVVYKMQANLAEVIDPNLYFFANHPRERIGIREQEMFPYILLPAFILGLTKLRKRNAVALLMSVSPLALVSVIGNSSPIGPFALFPLLGAVTILGVSVVLNLPKRLVIPLTLIYLLVLVQTYSYATH